MASLLAEDGGFPNDNIFATILSMAREVDQVVIRDPAKGVNASHNQLITDLIHTRHQLRTHLSSYLDPQNGSVFAEPLMICVLTPANYEYTVAMFAILALGGTVMPLPTNSTLDLVLHHLCNNPVKYVLAGSDFREQAEQTFRPTMQVEPIPIMNACPDKLWDLPNLNIAEEITIPQSRPGIVFFSSGSTGVPRGVVHSREYFYNKPRLSPDEGWLVHRPASWLGGTLPLATAVMGGARAEIIHPHAPAQEFWDRLRERNITTLMTTVVLWEKLARHYKDHLTRHSDRDQYLAGMQNVRTAIVGASVPVPSLLKFYREELRKPLAIGYGSTESGTIVSAMSTEDAERTKKNRGIGKQLSPKHPFKLSEGDSGELLIGGLTSLLGYLNDEAATKKAFDEEGYFRTGDLCHRDGEYYFFDGRACVDFIKAVGGPVPVCELEDVVQTLDYLQDAYVIPVEDQVIGRRVGVIARPCTDGVNLAKLRTDLSSRVSPHMLPSAFRPLALHETLPLTYTDKIAKKEIMRKFFSCDAQGKLPEAVELTDLEFQ